MSIFPSTDLIVEVADSANPQARSAAMARLAALSAGSASGSAQFEALMASKTGKLGASEVPANSAALYAAPTLGPSPQTQLPSTKPEVSPSTSNALRKFEAYFIQSSLEMLLPKEGAGAYGADASSGVWRSMMAEQLGNQIAKAGGLGLQKILSRHWAARFEQAQSSDAIAARPRDM